MGIGSTMGSGSYWAVLGAWAGEAFMAYGLALMIACLGPTVLALVLHLLLMTRSRGRPVTVALELVYGLLNPVMYLLVLQPGLFRSTTPAVLSFLQSAVLFAYWSWRLVGSRVAAGDRGRRAAAFAITTAAVLLIASTAVRDLVVTVIAPPDLNGLPLVVVLVGPLYAFPLWIGSSQLMRLVRETDGSDSGFFFKSRVAVFVAAGVATVGTVLVALASMNQSNDAARSLVRAHRADILAAAEAERIDPRTLAAVMAVTHREHLNAFKNAIEVAAANAWLTDKASHTPLASALNPSLGVMQVKPVTVLTALWIDRASGGDDWRPSKEFRDVSFDVVKRVHAAGLAGVMPPPFLEGAGKEEVVRALLQPDSNLRIAAHLLNVYAHQWEAQDPAWAIRHRPEILATLFQIGFERSAPKANPAPNEFGRAVLQEFCSDWARAEFPPDPRRSPRRDPCAE